jgi:hypothetical protein
MARIVFDFAPLALIAALATPAHGQSRDVAPGATWAVARETSLQRLDIGAGATLVATDGRHLALTVDGVGTAIAPGTYQGHLVLTPVRPVGWKAMLGTRDYQVVTGLYVANGAPDLARSVPAVWQGGQVGPARADNLHIVSAVPGFTGVAIEGRGDFVLNDPVIRLSGNGVDDSIGYGAGIVVQGDAHVVINRPRIVAHGVVRTAIFAAGNATLDVNGADIETYNGMLPAGYRFSILPGEMMEVPYGLGITGNVRATNVQGTARVTYRDSHIRAQAWGALATDGAGPTALTAIDSLIETVDSGYGAYANGEAHDLFDHCVFRVRDYGAVIGGPGSATFTNGTMVSSARFGVMMHQGDGGGTLRIDKGSVFVTGQTAILVKGRGTTIVIDGARLVPGNGVLIQTMENDDPIMRDMMRNGPPPGAAPPPPPPAGAPPKPHYSGEVIASIANTTLAGDVLHAMAGKGGMTLSIAQARLTGAISLAQAHPAGGAKPTRETLAAIGEVTDTLGFGAKPEPLRVTLGAGAHWTVTRTSYLTELTIDQAARIDAPTGRQVQLVVDGRPQPLAPGHYAGAIELRVMPEA